MPIAATAEPCYVDYVDAVPSDGGTERVLANSYHVATLDDDAPAFFEESTHLARRVTGP